MEGRSAPSAAMPAVWKTIKLGICKSPDEYRKAIKHCGLRIPRWGNALLDNIACAQKETEVDLVVLSVKELGFDKKAHYKDICAKGIQMGLRLCPAEVGPALRLAYGDQPRGDLLRIAMKAITNEDGYCDIFAVDHDAVKPRLNSYFGRPMHRWNANHRFVFVRPRQ